MMPGMPGRSCMSAGPTPPGAYVSGGICPNCSECVPVATLGVRDFETVGARIEADCPRHKPIHLSPAECRTMLVDIVFTAPPGPGGECVFVEAETLDGRSVRLGEWIEHEDGSAALRIEVAGTAIRDVPGAEVPTP